MINSKPAESEGEQGGLVEEVMLPTHPLLLGDEVYLVKLPNFLSIEPRLQFVSYNFKNILSSIDFWWTFFKFPLFIFLWYRMQTISSRVLRSRSGWARPSRRSWSKTSEAQGDVDFNSGGTDGPDLLVLINRRLSTLSVGKQLQQAQENLQCEAMLDWSSGIMAGIHFWQALLALNCGFFLVPSFVISLFDPQFVQLFAGTWRWNHWRGHQKHCRWEHPSFRKSRVWSGWCRGGEVWNNSKLKTSLLILLIVVFRAIFHWAIASHSLTGLPRVPEADGL